MFKMSFYKSIIKNLHFFYLSIESLGNLSSNSNAILMAMHLQRGVGSKGLLVWEAFFGRC